MSVCIPLKSHPGVSRKASKKATKTKKEERPKVSCMSEHKRKEQRERETLMPLRFIHLLSEILSRHNRLLV